MSVMRALLVVFAILGFVAVLQRIARATMRVARGTAEGYFARVVARSRAQRGDLTGLAEAQQQRQAQRRTRLIALLELLVWLALLFLPLLTMYPMSIFACMNVLWLPRFISVARRDDKGTNLPRTLS